MNSWWFIKFWWILEKFKMVDPLPIERRSKSSFKQKCLVLKTEYRFRWIMAPDPTWFGVICRIWGFMYSIYLYIWDGGKKQLWKSQMDYTEIKGYGYTKMTNSFPLRERMKIVIETVPEMLIYDGIYRLVSIGLHYPGRGWRQDFL